MKRIIGISAKFILALALAMGITHKSGVIMRPLDTDVAFMPKNALEVIGYGSGVMMYMSRIAQLTNKSSQFRTCIHMPLGALAIAGAPNGVSLAATDFRPLESILH